MREVWDAHAEADPLWAVLSFSEKKGRRWQLHEFMKTGEREIALLFQKLAQLDFRVPSGPILDFGCGVGRLTQAFARRREEVISVDISPVMIDIARRLNQYPDRATYLPIAGTGLEVVGNLQFALIYSNMVLQHVEPNQALEYLHGLFGLLHRDGLLVFQLPSHRAEAATIEIRPMDDEAYRASLELARPLPLVIDPGAELPVLLRVRNTSGRVWSQPSYGPMAVGNHWLDESGARMILQDDGRAPLLQEVSPGQEWLAGITLRAPAESGVYTGELDLVHEGVTWFEHKGSPTLRFRITVADDAGASRWQRPVMEEYRVPDYPEDALPRAVKGQEPQPFAMNAIARDEVIALVREHSGRLLHLEEDRRAGPEWVSYTYFVSRSPNSTLIAVNGTRDGSILPKQ